MDRLRNVYIDSKESKSHISPRSAGLMTDVISFLLEKLTSMQVTKMVSTHFDGLGKQVQSSSQDLRMGTSNGGI